MTPFADRDDELDLGDSLLAAACAGDGSSLVVQGSPGTGKTALLNQFARRARASGFEVLIARGIAIEQNFDLGIVAQLLESHLGDHGESIVATPPGSCDSVRLATLFKALWNLARRQPVMVVVDDLQWADETSIRFLRHLAARIHQYPIALVVSWRTGFESDVGRALLIDSDAAVCLRPLSRAATSDVIRSHLGDVDEAVVDACVATTGGNPFLLSELLSELRRSGPPASIRPDIVHRTAPGRIAAWAEIQASKVGAAAPRFLRVVTVLGEHARLGLCAQLADTDMTCARETANVLAIQGLLAVDEHISFLHPIVNTSIYASLSQLERTSLHAEAARILSCVDAAPPTTIARHLLATSSTAEPEYNDLLRATARRLHTDGEICTAVELLKRALDSVTRPEARSEILLELGLAELDVGDDRAVGHLAAAFESAANQRLRARALIAHASATWATGTTRSQYRRLEPAELEDTEIDVLDSDPDLALELAAARFGTLLANPQTPHVFADAVDRYRNLDVHTQAGHLMLSFVARADLVRGHIEAAADRAAESVRDPGFAGGLGHPLWRINVVYCLIEAQRFDEAETLLSQLMCNVGESTLAFLTALWLRALTRHRRGNLQGAAEDARRALDSQQARPTCGESLPAVLVLIDVLTDQGHHGEALTLIDDYDLGVQLPSGPYLATALAIRGRARAGAGQTDAARIDFEEAVRRTSNSLGFGMPGPDPRLDLCRMLSARGDDEAARELVDTALDDALAARSGHRLAIARRVAGLVYGGTEGLELLRSSAHLLAESPMQLERAKSLTEYGASLRRAGQLCAAREVLREAQQLATHLGAASLTDRLSDELRAAGIRPRRAAFGTAALTASELRVAHLASTGMSNKEIAKSLFVAVRTVELHLSNTFNKLDIRSRHEIATALSR